jgi:hypothetical protein
MTTVERIATNVRTIVAARRLKMKTVIASFGMSPQVFYKRMKGESKWSIDELEVLAEILDVDVADFLRDPSALVERTRGWSTADEMVAA